MKLINLTLHGNGKKEPQKVRRTYCPKSDSCSLHKNGVCKLATSLLGFGECPIGTNKVERGYTTRAAAYYKWKKDITYHENYNKLSRANADVFVVDNTLIITTSLIKHKIEDDKYLFRTVWNEAKGFKDGLIIPLDKLTPEILNVLYNLKPRAFFDNTIIKSYQEEIIRDLKITLKEFTPHLLPKNEEISYIGKEAVLKTINPCELKVKGKKWSWDGEWLTTKETPFIFWSSEIEESITKIKPKDSLIIEITSNEQVNKDTIFK